MRLTQSSSLPSIRVNRTAYEKSVLLKECESRLARTTHTRSDLPSLVSKATKTARVPRVTRGSYQVNELQMKQWAGSWESVSCRSAVGRTSVVGQLSSPTSCASEARLPEEVRQPELAESEDAMGELLPAGDLGTSGIWERKRSAIALHLPAQREEAMRQLKSEAREEHALARRAFRSHDWVSSINHLNSALSKAHSEPLLRLRARATLRSDVTPIVCIAIVGIARAAQAKAAPRAPRATPLAPLPAPLYAPCSFVGRCRARRRRGGARQRAAPCRQLQAARGRAYAAGAAGGGGARVPAGHAPCAA